jgi:hypothetical protein
MALSRPSGWADELGRWLAPFLAALSRPEQRRWAPLSLRGLLLPGERKSIEPMAARIAPGEVQHGRNCTTLSPPPRGRPSRWRRSWCARPTGWSAARTRRWWWTTPPW